jgi:hypothetical protein
MQGCNTNGKDEKCTPYFGCKKTKKKQKKTHTHNLGDVNIDRRAVIKEILKEQTVRCQSH